MGHPDHGWFRRKRRFPLRSPQRPPVGMTTLSLRYLVPRLATRTWGTRQLIKLYEDANGEINVDVNLPVEKAT